jgi:Flp pilus assembly pilin Flp
MVFTGRSEWMRTSLSEPFRPGSNQVVTGAHKAQDGQELKQRAIKMKSLLTRFWKDDCGAVISIEYLFFVTIVVLGAIVGLAALRDAIVTELTELGNAILALSQGYTVSGISGSSGSVDGTGTIDTSSTLTPPIPVPPSAPSPIDVFPQ